MFGLESWRIVSTSRAVPEEIVGIKGGGGGRSFQWQVGAE